MIILIQGIRSGAGASFLAASLSWQLSLSSKKVLALSANDSDAPLELYFNFPEPCGDGWLAAARKDAAVCSALWHYTDSLYVLPMGKGEAADSFWVDRSHRIKAACTLCKQVLEEGFTDIVIDAGVASGNGRSLFNEIMNALADYSITSAEPDAGSLMTLAGRRFASNEEVLLNKLRSESASMREASKFLYALPGVSEKLVPFSVPWDDLALEAAFLSQPISQTVPDAASAKAISSLACWIRVSNRRRQTSEGVRA